MGEIYLHEGGLEKRKIRCNRSHCQTRRGGALEQREEKGGKGQREGCEGLRRHKTGELWLFTSKVGTARLKQKVLENPSAERLILLSRI